MPPMLAATPATIPAIMTKTCCCCCSCCCCKKNEKIPHSIHEVVKPKLVREVRPDPDLFSPLGVSPRVVQVINPVLYSVNEEEEDVGKKPSVSLPSIVDLNHPSDPRGTTSALTPYYRGHQNGILVHRDKHAIHNIATSDQYCIPSGTWYSIPGWNGDLNTLSSTGYVQQFFFATTLTAAEKTAKRQEWYDWIFPSDTFCMRGLKQMYNFYDPFVNESAPTVKEFEDWNLKVINLFRGQLGFTLTQEHLTFATYDEELFLKASWSEERKFTASLWDHYTGVADSCYGPCVGNPGELHCGECFVPSLREEQYAYWNSNVINNPPVDVTHPTLTYTSGGATGILQWWNGTFITSMSRLIRTNWRNGVDGGHGGPLVFRPYLGYVFKTDTGNHIRMKWTGPLYPIPAGKEY